MTKKTRTILFSICVVLFLLAAPVALFYFLGYRFDFAAGKVVQTGAIYLKVAPRSADVYLNGKQRDTTSVFTGSTLIENLVPKTYTVEIKKEGYHSWQKTLTVEERQVAEAKNIVLFPENPEITALDLTEQGFQNLVSLLAPSATSSDGQKVVEADAHEIWVNLLKDNRKSFLTRFSETLGPVFWLNNDYLVFSVGNKIKVAEIDDRDRLNVIDLAEFIAPRIFWDRNSGKLYLLSQDGYYVLNGLLP